MRKKKRLCALLLCMAMLLGCTGCGSSTSSGNNPNDLVSTAGKDVTRAAAADNVFSLNCNNDYSFNPLIATNHSNQLVCSLVYENMVELDNSFEVIPNLLTSWICNEEATYWTFEIAEGHYFSDGYARHRARPALFARRRDKLRPFPRPLRELSGLRL